MSIEIKISNQPISYKNAINFLEKRVELIKKDRCKDLLWILEHPTTYTAGISSNNEDVLDKSIKIISTNRGGKITLHNPGQKIIYFAIDLNKKRKDIRYFINILEKSIIEFLKIYKIKSYADKKNIGIWVNGNKISAIGVRVSKWIAYHGCSININNDLDKYKKIIPCGLDNKKITSLCNEGVKPILEVNKNLKDIFLRNLNKF